MRIPGIPTSCGWRTELGGYVSLDRGATWHSLEPLGLPRVRVDDIVIHPRENDVVVGTHGRSIWILDDAAPIQGLSEARRAGVHLFDPPPVTRYTSHFTKPFLAQGAFAAEQPGREAFISYHLPREIEDGVTIAIEDGNGTVLRTLEGPGERGVNRTRWPLDMDVPGEDPGRGGFAPSSPNLRVLPGTSTVRLSADGAVRTATLEVAATPHRPAPRTPVSARSGRSGR